MTARRGGAYRMKRYGVYRGKRVRVTMGHHDGLGSKDGDVVTGTVIGIATRHQGRADWRGTQYDMVLNDEGQLHTFALSRIRQITVVPS